MLLKKLIFASGARVLSLVLLLLVCLLTPSTCSAYRDPVLVPGTVYHANDVRHVHNLVRKYMRYSTAATSFVDFDDGWTSCGIACNSPDVRTVMLNVTWHIDFPLSDGFVALHHNDREIVVSWAGTHRYRALLMDMVFFTSPYIEGEDMNVHSGFLESVRGIIGPVKQHLEALMDEFPDYTVVVTGHSKGGAEAALCALDLARQISRLRKRMRVWTFGQPRVGDAAFARYYNQVLGDITYRVTGVADPVVAVPPQILLDYCHHGHEVWIMNKEGDIYVAQNSTECEDPAASLSVPFFLRTIQSHKDYLGLPPPDHADAEFSW